jgi:hypothetical protein
MTSVSLVVTACFDVLQVLVVVILSLTTTDGALLRRRCHVRY